MTAAVRLVIERLLTTHSSRAQSQAQLTQEECRSCQEVQGDMLSGLRQVCQQSLALCLTQQILTMGLSQLLEDIIVRHHDHAPFSTPVAVGACVVCLLSVHRG